MILLSRTLLTATNT